MPVKNKNFLSLLGILVFCSSLAWAEEEAVIDDPAPEPAAMTTKKKAIMVQFSGDELVAGGAPNPDMSYISQKDEKNYKKLIHLRDNFIPEAQRGRAEFSADE
jgi:hypothetical protein